MLIVSIPVQVIGTQPTQNPTFLFGGNPTFLLGTYIQNCDNTYYVKWKSMNTTIPGAMIDFGGLATGSMATSVVNCHLERRRLKYAAEGMTTIEKRDLWMG
ncbi:hypothetical protein [Paraburkholderia bannensis]|uniref:hypothetical protein n=1 Tax=Paraburkholderia bannensis TaxID=765414 RepID=UPI002AC34866|nr:hypothetical protein [Paraburkholderia bannensis]